MEGAEEREDLLELLGPALTNYEEDNYVETNTAPEISEVRFEPDRVDKCYDSGTLVFMFRDDEGNIESFHYQQAWSHSPDGPFGDWVGPTPGDSPIAAEELGMAGEKSGDATVTMDTICGPPEYWYYRVWLVDAEGEESNVAEAMLLVGRPAD